MKQKQFKISIHWILRKMGDWNVDFQTQAKSKMKGSDKAATINDSLLYNIIIITISLCSIRNEIKTKLLAYIFNKHKLCIVSLIIFLIFLLFVLRLFVDFSSVRFFSSSFAPYIEFVYLSLNWFSHSSINYSLWNFLDKLLTMTCCVVKILKFLVKWNKRIEYNAAHSNYIDWFFRKMKMLSLSIYIPKNFCLFSS